MQTPSIGSTPITPLAASCTAPIAAAPTTTAPPASTDSVTLSGASASKSAAPAERPLTERAQSLLKKFVDPEAPSFIPKENVDAMCKQLGCGPEQLLMALVPAAKDKARPPISEYYVGAAGLGKSGAIYLGINTEYANLTLQHTTHGEQGVVNSALTQGETQLTSLAISADPCGHCRQFLNELTGAEGLKILLPGDQSTTLKAELPKDFGPKDLGVEGALLSPKSNGLTLGQRTSVWSVRADHERGASIAQELGLLADSATSVVNATRVPLSRAQQPAEDGALAQKALGAANRAYAPYSKDYSGIAIRMADGSVITGAYAENAAFNPSLNPAQSAFINIAFSGKKFEDIREVALVEPSTAGFKKNEVSQVDWTLDVLHHIAPDATLSVYAAQRPA